MKRRLLLLRKGLVIFVKIKAGNFEV